MSRPERKRNVWLPLVLLLASSYALWVLPQQWRNEPVRVEFEEAGR